MKEVIQHLDVHSGMTKINEYVAAADQPATQITKKSYDTPESPPSFNPIPIDTPVSIDFDIILGGEPPINYLKILMLQYIILLWFNKYIAHSLIKKIAVPGVTVP